MEPLVIPITMSGAEALKVLDQLKRAGAESGAGVKKGADDAKESHEGLATAIRRVNIESMAISAGRDMLNMLSQAAIDASRDLQRMAQEFIALRERAKELAGVVSRKGDIEFTKEQIKFAAETGFADPNKAVDYRTAFQGEANQYQERFKSPEEYSQFEKEAARLGNQNNVPADVMAKIAGMVIRTGAAEGQTSEQAMQRLGGSFKTMMAGSGGIGELAGQLGRMSGLVGEGRAFKNVEEAAVSTRMSAETNLPEAYTTATEIRQGVVELATDEKQADKAKELGITPETTNFESIKKLSDAHKASGENIDVFLRKYFPMKRIRDSFRDQITAYRNNVMASGLKDAAKVQAGQIEGETAAYFADPLQPGMGAVEKAKEKLQEATLGEDKATIAPFMTRAHAELLPAEEKPGAKMFAGMMDKMSGWWRGSQGMGYTGFEQVETAKAMGNIRTEAEAAGIDTGNAPNVATAPQREVEHYMADLVRLTREANEQRRKTEQKPLSAPPPNPQTRP